MAESSKTIELIFQGIDKTADATRSALSNVEKFSGSIKDVTQPIADFTAGAVKLEAGLLTAGAAIVAFSVKSASDFDSAFRQISTIIDASADDLGKFKGAILEYASTSTQPLEKITNALGAAIGSGVDWSKSLELISTAEKLAVATRSDLDGTTKVLVSTLNSYGLGIEKAGSVSDLFFKIIDKGDISMTDLANSFAKVAPVAKISGVSLQEIGAAISTLTASGIKPAESIEYLRGAISNIISPSGQAKDLAEELGIQFNAQGLKAKGLAGILQEVAEKTGGSADKMKILFGDIGGFTAAATLAGPQAATYRDNIKAMGDSAGSTAEAFKKMADSTEVSAAKMASAFRALTANIGAPLLDEFGGIANALAKIFEALGASAKDGSLKVLVEFIEKNLKDLQTAVETVATNLPAALAKADFSGFKGGIDAVIGAFKSLFGSIDLSSVDGLTRAIEAAGAAFLGLSNFTAGVVESFKPLFEYLVKIGKEAGGINPDVMNMAGNIAGLATQLNILVGGINSALPAMETFIGLLAANQGISLLVGLRTIATTAPAAVASLVAMGPAVIAVIAAFAGVGAVALAYSKLDDAQKRLKESQDLAETNGKRVQERLKEFAEGTGYAVKSLDEAWSLYLRGYVIQDEVTGKWKRTGEAMREVSTSAKDSAVAIDLANKALMNTVAVSAEAKLAVAQFKYEQNNLLNANEQVAPIYDKATGALVGYGRALIDASKDANGMARNVSAMAQATDAAAKKTKEAEDAQKKWNEEVLKMQHAEKMKMIEAQTAITTARITADAEKLKAAFESINTTITSTGSTLSTLYGLLKDFGNMDWTSRRMVEDQMNKESASRGEAMAMQSRLIAAQIKELEARTKKMEAGDALIKIDGAGLKPHLEAFMWEILRAIQTRVNKDGLELLMGVK